jgi:hypothetical protein
MNNALLSSSYVALQGLYPSLNREVIPWRFVLSYATFIIWLFRVSTVCWHCCLSFIFYFRISFDSLFSISFGRYFHCIFSFFSCSSCFFDFLYSLGLKSPYWKSYVYASFLLSLYFFFIFRLLTEDNFVFSFTCILVMCSCSFMLTFLVRTCWGSRLSFSSTAPWLPLYYVHPALFPLRFSYSLGLFIS